MDREVVISKSRYLKGLQCLKYLWYLVNRREAIPQPDFAGQFIFNQGIQVGEYAKKLYPGGVDPGKIKDFGEQIEATRRALSGRNVIFEASCSHGNVYARADILVPADGDRWDLIEVKSINTVKNYLEILENVYLFFGIDLFDFSIKRQIYNPSKIYSIDPALSRSVAFKFSHDSGHLYENFVFIELLRRNKEVFYWKSKRGKEVDFLIKEGLPSNLRL